MKIGFKVTSRGFRRAEFTDLYGKKCSLQKSSLATADAVWLGCDEGVHMGPDHMPTEFNGTCLARMHLTREHVKALLPHLQKFAKTGEL